MNKIHSILKKNILVLIKSKWWVLVIIIGPLLLMFLSGVVFDNLNEYKLNIGVYAPIYDETTNSFISKINTDEFRTLKANSEIECIDFIKLGIANACVVFPSGTKELIIYIDYSKLNLAWVVRDKLFSRVEERSTEITRELTDNVLSKLIIIEGEASNALSIAPLISENELRIAQLTADTVVVLQNNSNKLNISNIDKLLGMINSVKVANDEIVLMSKSNLNYTNSIVGRGDFDQEIESGYIEGINKRRADILLLQNYILSLYSAENPNSFNNSIYNIGLWAIQSNSAILKGEEGLRNIASLSETNNKMLRRLNFSMENLKKEIYNTDNFSAEDIASPVTATIQSINSYNTNLNYVFPTLMVLAIMLASLLLSSIVVVMELNSAAFFRNVISPVRESFFFFTQYLTNLTIIGIQIFLMILVSMFFFLSQIAGNIINTSIVCFVIATFFIILGLTLGYLFRTEQMSVLAATFTASIFMFFSNLLVPIENMPLFFTNILQYNPFIVSVSLIRKVILFNQTSLSMLPEISYLIFLTVLLIIFHFLMNYIFGRKQQIK